MGNGNVDVKMKQVQLDVAVEAVDTIELRMRECESTNGTPYFIGNIEENKPVVLQGKFVVIVNMSENEGGGAVLTIKPYDERARKHKFRYNDRENSKG